MNFTLKTSSFAQVPVRTAIAMAVALVVTPATAQTAAAVVGDVQQGVYDAQQVHAQARGVAYSLQRGGIGGAMDAASGVLNILGSRTAQKTVGAVAGGNPAVGETVQGAQAGIYDARNLQAGVGGVSGALQRGGVGGAMDAASGVFNMLGNRSVQKAAGAITGSPAAGGVVHDAQSGIYDARNVQAHVGGVSSGLQRGGINGALDAASSAVSILGNRSVQNAVGAVAGAATPAAEYASPVTSATQPVIQPQSNAVYEVPAIAYRQHVQIAQPGSLPQPAPTPSQGGCIDVTANLAGQAQAVAAHVPQRYVAAARPAPNPEHMRLQELNRRAMGLN